MAFPTVEATASTGVDSSDPKEISLPAGIQAEDLLLVAGHSRAIGTVGGDLVSGWELLYSRSLAFTSAQEVYYRVATGSEGSTVEYTQSGTGRAAWVAYRISKVAIEAMTFIEAADTDGFDPPELTASWGEGNNLWLSIMGRLPSNGDITQPTGYGSVVEARVGNTLNNNFPLVAGAQKDDTDATDDPDTWAVSAGSTVSPASSTIVIQAGGSTPPTPPVDPANRMGGTGAIRRKGGPR